MAQVYEYEDIFIGSDHGGFALKAALIAQTQGTGLSLHDLGPRALSPGDDYPHYAFQVAQAVAMRQAAAQPYLGVLCCKSGAGMVIAANKVAGVRAVEAISVEQVKRTRDHNDANVLCFGAELLDENFASEIDYGLGWSGSLSKFGLKGQVGDLVVDLGITYFDEPGVFTFGPGDVWYSHVKLTKSIDKVNVFALFENYTVAPGSGFEGGNLYSVGASTFRSVPKTPLSLFCSLSCTYDDGGFGFDNGFLLKGCVEADWKVTSHISLILPRISYYVPLTVRDSRETDAVISGGISLKF
jgi:ribose 5-phosphate isomerase B